MDGEQHIESVSNAAQEEEAEAISQEEEVESKNIATMKLRRLGDGLAAYTAQTDEEITEIRDELKWNARHALVTTLWISLATYGFYKMAKEIEILRLAVRELRNAASEA